MMAKIAFDKISDHEGPKESPGFLLWRVSTSWRTHIESVLRPLGLTHPQFVMLATTGWLTRDGEGVTQIAIGKMAELDPNTTSQILKGLEQRGFIRRVSSADARAKQVTLSAEGAVLLAKALPAVEGADKVFFDRLTVQEHATWLRMLQKLS